MMKISRAISAAEFLRKITFLAGIVLLVSCSTDDPITPEVETEVENIVIFSINDPHGKIHNFDKIKAIIDKEKETESQVFFVSGGIYFPETLL